jgi:hypothetical protein
MQASSLGAEVGKKQPSGVMLNARLRADIQVGGWDPAKYSSLEEELLMVLYSRAWGRPDTGGHAQQWRVAGMAIYLPLSGHSSGSEVKRVKASQRIRGYV